MLRVTSRAENGAWRYELAFLGSERSYVGTPRFPGRRETAPRPAGGHPACWIRCSLRHSVFSMRFGTGGGRWCQGASFVVFAIRWCLFAAPPGDAECLKLRRGEVEGF